METKKLAKNDGAKFSGIKSEATARVNLGGDLVIDFSWNSVCVLV